MIEYVVVLELSVPVVIKVDADLLAGVYPIPAQNRSAACRDPNARQGVGVHLVLLDQPLALFVHVDAAMLTMVNLNSAKHCYMYEV